MFNYLPFTLIMTLFTMLGYRRGTRSQLMLLGALVGTWLVIASSGRSLLRLIESTSLFLLRAGLGGEHPELRPDYFAPQPGFLADPNTYPLLFVAVAAIGCGVVWHFGTSAAGLSSLRGALVGALNGLWVSYVLFPERVLPWARRVAEESSSAVGPTRVVGDRPEVLIIAAVFGLIFLAVRWIRRPGMGPGLENIPPPEG